MNELRKFNLIVVALLVATAISCKNDDANNLTLDANLFGEWQRSDADTTFEYVLIFNEDESGLRTQRETDLDDGTQISSAEGFTWSVNDGTLQLNFDGEITTSNYSFNADGQLLLDNITLIPFNRIDE